MQRTETSASKKSRKRKHEEIVDEIELSQIDVEGGEESAEEEKAPKKKRARKGEALTTMQLLAQLQPLPPIEERDYSSKDTDLLSENENFRYMFPSKKVGHAVIVKGDDGKDLALQFQIPQGDKDETPEIRELNNIKEIERFGMKRYSALTSSGTQMYAARFIDGEFNNEKFKIASFSPEPKIGKEPFWGSKKDLDIFNEKALADPDVKKHFEDIAKDGIHYKCGRDFPIDPVSVQKRDHESVRKKSRKPDQNEVMGESARDAYEAFFNDWTDELTPKMKEVFRRAFEAPLRDPKDAPLKEKFRSHFRPEWLHGEGHGLTPADQDPQRKDNLGAAGKWVNTEMMVLERIVKWFALNRPAALESIKPRFEMLLDSELIKRVNFEVSIEEKDNIVKLLQDINPFKEWPVFRKATDLTQATAITYSMLNGIDPISVQPIKGGETLRARTDKDNQEKKPLGKRGKLADAAAVEKPIEENAAEKPLAVAKKKVAVSTPVIEESVPFDVTSFPTKVSYEKSVLQISSTFQTYDYAEPWSGAEIHYCHGSGSVVEHDGRKYILTNAHVVENAVDLDVRFANDRARVYEATVFKKITGYQCDLALLEIDDAEFQEKAIPVELGDMVAMKQLIETVGFPMGGSEISISDGIVSRIEVRDYCMSGLDMLQVQIDAAVNPGNSGGPVFSGDKQVGVAFQGYDRQGLGFMIPMPIVKHFLTEVFSDKPYRGFPILPVEMQTLENAALRQYYGLVGKQMGVRIKSIDLLSDAYKKLKVDDVLIEIDGLPVSNRGTVDLPGIGNVIDLVHVTHQKFIGDNVNLKVLRRNESTKKIETVALSVELDCIPWDSTKVPVTEHDKMPTYFINSGVVFMPLTRNYLEDRGGDLDEFINADTGERISEVAKKEPGEEYVIINTILNHKDTKGYDDVSDHIVKEVNGVKINNLNDLIGAMENNQEPFHIISSGTRNKIIVPNMTRADHDKLLKRYHINFDRSEDLRSAATNVDAMDIDEPIVKPIAKPAQKTTTPVVKPKAEHATTARLAAMLSKMGAELEALKNKDVANEKDESEELLPDFEGFDESPVPVSTKKAGELTAADLPGAKRFRQAVDRIEAQSKLMDDLGFEDEGIDLDDLGEGDESDDDISVSSEEEKPTRRASVAKHHATTFAPKNNKRRRDDDADEEELARKQKHARR